MDGVETEIDLLYLSKSLNKWVEDTRSYEENNIPYKSVCLNVNPFSLMQDEIEYGNSANNTITDAFAAVLRKDNNTITVYACSGQIKTFNKGEATFCKEYYPLNNESDTIIKCLMPLEFIFLEEFKELESFIGNTKEK